MTREDIYVIGVDIGGTHISSAVVDVREKRIIDDTYTTSHVANLESLEAIMETWASTLNKTIHAAAEIPLLGIAFAIPGPFDYKEGIAKYPEGFKYGALYQAKIEENLNPLLSHSSHLPMRFLNDATSFAVGEAWLSHADGNRKQLCITLGTGLGAGFIENGVPIVTGNTVPPNGCLWNILHEDGMADDYFSTRGFIKAYHQATGKNIVGVKELVDNFDADAKIKEVFHDFGNNLGGFLTPWLKKFQADVLVLGGNISKAYSCFGVALEQCLDQNDLIIPIRISHHMEKGAIIGCTRMFDPNFWEHIKNKLPKI
ncbi:ROK family protein [Flagellimonas aquimarina]|uniref:ROK family protein n=1 Tax=Flagellimonas aquimarina TaxID=2201895 RepID=A0A316L069_9FLAO|nr:ROK family protein [Allomuricauda koreensis]PWL39504.1 ROK family protein [Allomuricauda koreensis]